MKTTRLYMMTSGLLAGVLCSPVISAKTSTQAIFSDEKFQNALIGTYGVNAEIEPSLNDEEQLLVEDIYVAIQANELSVLEADLPTLITPESSAALDFILGNVLLQNNKPKKAIRSYEAAIDKFPSFARAHKNLGFAQAKSGDYQAATRSLVKVIELGKKDAWIYGVLAGCFYEMKNYLAAESAYRSALLFDSDSLEYEKGVLDCMFKQQKHADVVAASKSLIERFPSQIEFWRIQADSFIGLDQLEKAAENLELIRRMGGASPELLNRLGDLYFKKEQYNLASKTYLDSLGLNHTSDGVKGALKAADLLAERGLLEGTEKIVNEVRRVTGGKLPVHLQSTFKRLEARVLIRDSKTKEAASILETIVSENPLDGEALLLLGDYYKDSGSIQKAAFIYERASSLEAFEADAKVSHAQLLVQDGQYQKALPLLRQAQVIEPRQIVEELLTKVERLSKRR